MSLGLVFCGLSIEQATFAGVTHEVTQINLTFDPLSLEVAPGDTIRWIWTSGSHTVTSGTFCTFDGLYFDVLFDSVNPLFEFVVPLDLEGEIPYFCLPHCFSNMVGTFTVLTAAPCPSDINTDGQTNVTDLLALLGAWGTCLAPCGPDIDESGSVNVTDLLALLGAWGACP